MGCTNLNNTVCSEAPSSQAGVRITFMATKLDVIKDKYTNICKELAHSLLGCDAV
jgi:hypothetical protein